MGVCDSSINMPKLNTQTPSPNHYDSFESSVLISNNNNLKKNLKEITSSNIDKKNLSKLIITNSNNSISNQSNSKKNLINNKMSKISYFKGINTSKTVDKKKLNNNLNFTPNNLSNVNKSQIYASSQKNSKDKKKLYEVRNDSKKMLGSSYKINNINITNISIHNKSCKDVKPFYYKPKNILKTESNNKTHRYNTNNIYKNKKLNKRSNILDLTKSKDKLLSNKGSNKNITNLTRTEIHRSFNNISRISSNDKLNMFNKNFYINKKINFKLEHIIDVHDEYYNDNKNKPLYILDDITNYEHNQKENLNYSSETDYNNIIRKNKDIGNLNKIYLELLKLKKRRWQNDLINISNIIATSRKLKNKNQEININNILYKIINLFDHFNWIVKSIGFVFSSIIYENKEEPINNYNIDPFHFPSYDSFFWFKGFKWKGLYIRIDKDINCINNIKKEIKALKYFFLDYLHVIWNKDFLDDLNINDKNNILSNNIIFPLIGYCQINSYVLIVSSIIKPESRNINLEDLVSESKGKIELYSKINWIENNLSENQNKSFSRAKNNCINFKDSIKQNNNFVSLESININEYNKKKFLINKLNHSIDYNMDIRNESSNTKGVELKHIKEDKVINKTDQNNIIFLKDNFYINDLLRSKLFSGINKNNLIKIKTGKYILINIASCLPNLFENKFKNDINKYNFFGIVDGQKKFFTLNYNISLLINLKNVIAPKHYNKISSSYFNTLTPKNVLEKIYKVFSSSKLKLKNVIIGNIIFRILYFDVVENKKNGKKNFVDFLFNYNNELKTNNNYKINNNKKENENSFFIVKEPYVIVYDIIEPIKLDYSLIKSIKVKNNQTELINDLFFLRTNYIDYFMSWCDMFNKNSFNIKRYIDLKYYMRKFGINQNLLFFALLKINNEEISDIIKIHLLIKSFKFICYNKDNEAVMNKIKKMPKYKDLNLYGNLKIKLLLFIKSILYPNEILPSNQKLFKSIYEQLSFFSNILFFKFKLLDDYLSLGILNVDKSTLDKNRSFYSFFNIQSPQEFLKHCILIARKKPFLFLSELEYKLNFLIDPYIKFKVSISIESMSHKLNNMHIELNNSIIISYIDPDEISGLLLTKLIRKFEEKLKNIKYKNNFYDSYKKTNENNISNKIYDFETSNNTKKINNVVYFSNLNMKPSISNNKENQFNVKNNNNKSTIPKNNQKNKYEELNYDLEFENPSGNFEDNKSSNNMNNYFITQNNNIKINFNFSDNNEILSKFSSDKTMDESELPNQKISFDKNSNKSKNNNLVKIDNKYFKEINENIIFLLPANCHKVLFKYEKNKSYNNSQYLYANLDQYYYIKSIEIIKEWVLKNENIFKSITNSYDFICEKLLIKSYTFLFIYLYYIEKNPKDFLRVSSKLLSLFKNNIQYKLSLNEISLINLVQALSNNNYIQNEEYFSKSVMMFLMNYGDPRGRYNDSHGALQFPLWEIARKTYKLDETIINESFKEMYQALDFFEKNKGIYGSTMKNNSNMYNYNFVSNIRNNIDKIKIMNMKGTNDLGKKEEKIINDYNNNLNDTESIFSMINNIEETNEININREFTDLDISLNKFIFDNANVEKMCITHYIFPSISSKITNVGRVFYRKEFIIYIIKEIMSLFLCDDITYTKKYLDKKISEELIIKKEIIINKTSINQEKTSESVKVYKYNQTPLKIGNVNTENKIPNSSTCANHYLKFDKKYNNRNNQNSQMNNVFRNSKSFKSYSNGINNSKNINNPSKNSNNNNSSITRNTINNNNNVINNNDIKTKETNSFINTKIKKIFSKYLYEDLFQNLSYKKNLPNGIIISCGNNKHNETSHDRYEKLTLPRVIFKLKNEMINKIYSGWEHNIVLNNKGEIFSFGHNQCYQCGLPNNQKFSTNNENINDPTNISILHNNLRAIKVSCGNEHSLILSQDKNIFGIGNNEGGLLGLKDNKLKTYKPIKINFLHKININKNNENYEGKMSDISCGTMHNLALTEDGKVFSWGSLQGGQLGLSSDFLINLNDKSNPDKNYYLTNPTLIPYFMDNNIRISQISCGEAHSLALSNKGKIYSWGFGSNGQLGLGFCEDYYEPGEGLVKSRVFEPQLIHTFKDCNGNKTTSYNYNIMKIKEIKCGKTFSMFISNNNDLFACGINDLGQLGFKDPEKKENLLNPEIQCDDYIYPSLLRCFNNKKVEKISCGEGHCLAVIQDINNNTQSIWSWGNNKFGQIGHGLMVKISLPKEVEYLTDYNMNNFSDVSCGGFHSLILLKSKNNLDWIEKDYDEFILGVLKEIGDL